MSDATVTPEQLEQSSQNHWAPASGQMYADAFQKEVDAFGAIAAQPMFRRMVLQFADYEAHLARLNQDSGHRRAVRKLVHKGVVDTASPSPELVGIFCEAQVGACCELLKGRSMSAVQFNRDGMRLLAQQAIAGLRELPPIPPELDPSQYSDQQRRLLDAVNHVQNLDTIRVMQVVRLLGLITTQSAAVRQLSLAAGVGYRDIYGIHAVPRITPQVMTSSGVFEFQVINRQPANTVLIDNDPVYAEHYAGLNAEQGATVLALNLDADKALAELVHLQQASGFGPRNLVAGLRIDHRMIPDAAAFLDQLAAVIDSSADLLLTIGAGNNLAEFEGRLGCFQDLAAVLRQRGMQPVCIKLHAHGSSHEQRAHPNFGNLEYASYQVLYCKLLRKKLAFAGS